jgi:transketolase
VIRNVDGHDSEAIKKAINEAQAVKDKPTIICCKTTIGWGAPTLAGSAATHGAPLGHDEIAGTREKLRWQHSPFVISKEIYESWNAQAKGTALEQAWQKLFNEYQTKHPALAKEFIRRNNKQLPDNWSEKVNELILGLNDKKQAVATRKASQWCLDLYANELPEMMGGSADLTESNCTNWKGMELFSAATPAGRYIHYGVREFGMSAIMNGLANYGGIIPFGGTFLTFSDYARNAIRLASLMRARTIFVYTHDSIGLGEDGPTHQSIEHLPGLRLMPQLSIWRPCDTVESAVAWQAAIEHQGPTCLLFTRQAVPHQERNAQQITQIRRGGYVLFEGTPEQHPDVIIIATGSEVSLAVDAAKQLQTKDINARVVSIPSTDTFLSQDEEYRQSVLPDTVPARVAVEAAATNYWYQFVGLCGKVIGIDHFGLSAPAKDVFKEYGFTVDNVVAAAKEVILSNANASHQYQPKCATGKIE